MLDAEDKIKLDKIFEEYKTTEHEVFTPDRKMKIIFSKYKHKLDLIKSLNARIKRLEKQVLENGCCITDAMSLDFEIQNTKADSMQIKMDAAIEFLRSKTTVTAANLNEVIDMFND